MVLNERYRLDQRIATGGMGDVWRATDLALGRRVAVKVLLPSLLADPDFITRFRAEARMMAALRHPGIVQVFDTGEDTVAGVGRADYLVMEYVDGEPLSARIGAGRRLAAAETMAIVAQVAAALHAAHEGGIVHRDVKPSNLLVQADGTVVLVDFGVARSVAITSITSPNAVPGTALYMAPEQAAGRPVSAVTDVYALGVVAYHCVAGHTPFTGDNALEVAIKHLNDELPALPADVPRPAAEVIERALAKDPADRFPSARALAEAARTLAGDFTPDTALTATADSPTAATTAPAGAAAVGAGVAAASGGPPGPRTLPDMPAVPTGAPDPAGARWRAPLLGVAVAVLIAVVGLTAMLALSPDDGTPGTTDATPSATPGVGSSDTPTSVPSDEETTPAREDSRTHSTRPRPSDDAQPSVEPSEPEQEEPAPTNPPTTEPAQPTTAPTNQVPPTEEAPPGGSA